MCVHMSEYMTISFQIRASTKQQRMDIEHLRLLLSLSFLLIDFDLSSFEAFVDFSSPCPDHRL